MGAPPSNQARIESLEQGLNDLRSSITTQISQAVSTAAQDLQKTLLDHLNTFRDEQRRLQEEIHSTLTSTQGVDGLNRMRDVGADPYGKKPVNVQMGEMESGRPEGSAVGSGRLGGLTGQVGSGLEFLQSNGPLGNSGGSNWRYKKLDLPVYSGPNPDGWILRAERYFEFYRLTEMEKLEAAIVSLDGDALLWYQWENNRRPIRRWEELKGMLLRQFRPSSSGSLYEQWLNHNQTAGVVEYRRRFIELMAPLTDVPEEIAKGQFINGLKDDIRAEVRVMGPRSLDHAMDLAVKVEDKLQCGMRKRAETKGTGASYFSTMSYSPQSGNHSYSSFKSQASSISPSARSLSSYSQGSTNSTESTNRSPHSIPVARPVEVKRLSDKEFQLKREKGECFRCEEKWSVGHRCKNKELSVILLQPEEEGTVREEFMNNGDTGGECEDVLENSQPEISLNSVVGITSPKTMKLLGTLKGREVVVMVDPGATHNFISKEAVQKLEIPVLPSKSFGVSLGTGEAVQGEGECKSVVLQLAGITIVEDFLPLSLGNSDIILGVQWLEKLGTISTNWKT